MKTFTDESGTRWVADAREENTPRHHGRFYLVFYPEAEPARTCAVPEIRWQNAATAARTIATMSELELCRRLYSARSRFATV